MNVNKWSSKYFPLITPTSHTRPRVIRSRGGRDEKLDTASDVEWLFGFYYLLLPKKFHIYIMVHLNIFYFMYSISRTMIICKTCMLNKCISLAGSYVKVIFNETCKMHVTDFTLILNLQLSLISHFSLSLWPVLLWQDLYNQDLGLIFLSNLISFLIDFPLPHHQEYVGRYFLQIYL